jgi:hypothetical protein
MLFAREFCRVPVSSSRVGTKPCFVRLTTRLLSLDRREESADKVLATESPQKRKERNYER